MAEPDTNIEPETADIPVADTPAADSDIDALLREFEEGTSRPQPEQPQFDPAAEAQRQASEALRDHFVAQRDKMQLDQRQAELNVAQQQIMLEQHRRDLAEAIKEVRGDLPGDFFDDQFVTTWLDARANSDPRLQEMWLQRGENPRAIKAALNRLAGEFQTKFRRLPDPVATVDHEAVAQAVRGAGGKAPPEPAPDVGKMDDREFAEYKRSLGIYG